MRPLMELKYDIGFICDIMLILLKENTEESTKEVNFIDVVDIDKNDALEG